MSADPEQLLAAFPARLKALRTARHLSLQELALRAGVTKAFLSLLERGANMPSAASLESLATALGVTVAALFPDQAAEPVRVSLVRRGARISEHGTQYASHNLRDPLFVRNEFNPVIIACARSTFGPQRATTVGEQFIFMLQGSIDYLYDDVVYRMRPGDALYFNAAIPHGPQQLHTRQAEYFTCFVVEGYAWFDMRMRVRGGSRLPPHVPSSRPLSQRIARKLRHVRLNRFEMLETTSANSGLKQSTITAIEEGRVNPSAATLLKLAHAFNLPLQYFLEPTDYPHEACFFTTDARVRSVAAEEGACERYPLAQPLGVPLFFMPELRVYHRGGALQAPASASGQFFVLVVDGSCEFRCGDEVCTLAAGDALTGYARDAHGLTRVLSPSATLLHITSDMAGMVSAALDRLR